MLVSSAIQYLKKTAPTGPVAVRNLHVRGLPVRLPDELYLSLKKCHEHWYFLTRLKIGSLRATI
jgi:hypothetical protein